MDVDKEDVDHAEAELSHEVAKEERRRVSERSRMFTERGHSYELERRLKRLDSARKKMPLITASLKMSLEAEEDRSVIQREFRVWLQAYDSLLSAHDEYQQMLSDKEGEADKLSFQAWNDQFRRFKDYVTSWVLMSEEEPSTRPKEVYDIRPGDSASTIHSQVSRGSTRSKESRISDISLARIQVEQEKAEIAAKASALKERHELEQSKLDLSRREEELALKEQYEIAAARARVLEQFDTQSKVSSHRSAPHRKHSGSDRDPNVLTKPIERLRLNPSAKPFQPSPHSIQQSAIDPSQAVSSMLKELRKPQSEVQKFSGSPMDFMRFKRQFSSRIIAYTDSDDERMNYLEQYTIGEAHRIVVGYSHLDSGVGYVAAMQELEHRYGDPEVIAAAYIKKALEWPMIKPDSGRALDEFGIILMECQHAVQGVDASTVLEYADNLKRIVGKLPFFLHDKWRNIVMRTRDNHQSVRFSLLVDFVRWEARKANDPTYGKDSIASTIQRPHSKPNQPKVFGAKGLATNVSETRVKFEVKENPVHKRCINCSGEHLISECGKLKSETHEKKIDYLKSRGLCFGCLIYGHRSKDCKRRLTCGDCGKLHPTILHKGQTDSGDSSNKTQPKSSQTSESKQSSATFSATNTCCGHTEAGDHGRLAMSILPVRIKPKDSSKFVETYALLDSGSTATFCSEALMKALNVQGRKTKINLRTMGQEKIKDAHIIKGLEVCSLDGDGMVELPPVLSQETLPVSKREIISNEDLKQWSYLKGLYLPRIDSDIGLLIGINASKVMEPYEVIPSEGDGPFAVRTKLGWVVNGPLSLADIDYESSNCMSVQVNRMEVTYAPTLQDQLIGYFNYDFSERSVDDVQEYSQNDKQFIDSVTKSITYEDGHYTIGLPFKNETLSMPNNRKQAEQRLALLRRRFEKDSTLYQDYKAYMDSVLQNGYAQEVSCESIFPDEGKAWYLPHHGVYHPKRGKLRVVFDCAARYGGTSLNDQLLPGPNLTNNLVGTLLRFRQGNVALMSDVESMFHQVRVPPEDARFLRFLWWKDGDIKQPIVEYQMVVHLFGATSSPSCANFALLKSAEDNQELFGTQAAETLRHNFYVDDCLKSVDRAEEAVELYNNLRGICAKGGFNLTKWLSNDRRVMDSIPCSEWAKEAKDLDLDKQSLPIERALGVQWSAESDKFEFKINVKENPATRRGILSTVSSIYDPLGFLAPFILSAKSLLQELCGLRLGWDDRIPKALEQRWSKWLDEVQILREYKVERCVKPPGFEVQDVELHHFSDASETGYGVATYLRLVNTNGDIHCCLLTGKARVAPLKQVTIPRLELTAATVAVRTDRMVRRELELQIGQSYFWTDSMSVLQYIKNATSRYHTFVANRLSVIHEGSKVSQWNYVNTKMNPSDEASRGQSASDLLKNKRWIHGPSFLWRSKDEWPEGPKVLDNSLDHEDPEVRKVVTSCTVQAANVEDSTNQLINYHSSWTTLKRSVAWILRIKQVLKEKVQGNKEEGKKGMIGTDRRLMTVQDMREAEKAILQYTQRASYREEISVLQSGDSCVKKRSTIHRLDPIYEDGLLRVGGRLNRAKLPEESKHPVILPKNSHISMLILRHIHMTLMHDGRSHILSRLRQRYWIIQAPAAIRRIIKDCVICKKQRSPVGEQKMSDLPTDRLTADNPPFTYSGVDYFGPFGIKRGRSIVKRYGVLFTCLTIRAVHLEVADSMDTSSYICALRRFIARRGQVQKLRSDNGSNFVGAERELKEAIKNWNVNQIHDCMLQRDIDWSFNPPSGSHHGGVWERMIRTVRKSLNSVMKEQTLDDEGFRTLLCEVEAILNDRPITELSDQHNDLEALTPNHLLIMKLQPSLPPGLFCKEDAYSRRRWKQVQYLSDLFWKRWVKEYLPLLQERQKWHVSRRNFQTGDIVLVVDEKSPRNSWPLGKVVEVMPDRSGFVRQVKVKTRTSVLVRPIDKLCLILENESV